LPKKKEKKAPGIMTAYSRRVLQLGFYATVVKVCGALMSCLFILFALTVRLKSYAWKTKAEVTVVIKLNQGTMKGMGCHHSFLDLSLVTFFVSRQRK
jgi:hypothetical protein